MYCAEGLGSGINSKQNRYTAKGNIYKLEEYIYTKQQKGTHCRGKCLETVQKDLVCVSSIRIKGDDLY